MKIIGHRGARGLAPENTIASVTKALEAHVDEIEIDARTTKDGVAVLHHDSAISIGPEHKLIIKDCRYTELKSAKPDLTTLAEAIRTIDRTCPLIIEVKPAEATGPVIETVRSFLDKGWLANDFLFASFSQPILRSLAAAFPGIGLIVNERWSGVRANLRARELGAKRITMNQLWLWPGFIRSVSRIGHDLSAYTLNDSKKARRWARHGLFGVVTDYPDRFTNPD